MKVQTFSHLNGEKSADLVVTKDIIKLLGQLNYKIRPGCSKDLRSKVFEQLRTVGWSNKFRLDSKSQISLSSSLGEHVLCLQTGNMSRFYADFLKLQYVFSKGNAKTAFYITLSKDAAKTAGSNLVHFDRLVYELQLFKEIIIIPILVIGLS